MKISPARTTAFDVLFKIESEKAFSSVLLPLYEADLSTQDRSLCHELTLGVLRKQLYLDRLIDDFSENKKLDAAARIALRIGLYQLYFLDKIPDYSAINDSVNLVQYANKTSAKSFVNAILRRATRETPRVKYKDAVEKISIETSHPRWLIEKWIGCFGLEETEQLAAANNKVPPVAFRYTGKRSCNDSSQAKPSELVEGCFIASHIDTELLEAASAGDIYFQDEASQMVAVATKLHAGENFLDVCAAPGSKTTRVAHDGMPSAKIIVAGDLHWPRVHFLRENCRNQGVEFVNVVQYDAEEPLPFADKSFDAVLLDAPCSGTGTIRHNPEIRYFLTPADFDELSRKQLRLLRNASKMVKPGGRLIYSTCSLEPEENELVCAALITVERGLRLVKPDVAGRFIGPDNFARTFPHRDNMDGFFIASFEVLQTV